MLVGSNILLEKEAYILMNQASRRRSRATCVMQKSQSGARRLHFGISAFYLLINTKKITPTRNLIMSHTYETSEPHVQHK